ncbi:hypothetical protein ALP64_201259 [Pseudomonas syringae pv. actinidiae]|nr:hypothetical protein ALP64_201259 [Pseudomonas syringae pv. actinidiae]
MNHRMAIKVPARLRDDGLQQAAVAQVDQVAFGAWTTCDEHGKRQAGVIDDVMAALVHLSGKHLRPVKPETHRIVFAVAIVARRQQQRAGVFLFEQGPAAQCASTEQQTAEGHRLASQHRSHLSINHRRWR